MKRRSLLRLAALLPAGLMVSGDSKAWATAPPQLLDLREQATRLNELAANIHTTADARAFVDSVADIFSEELPAKVVNIAARDRIARAEYRAATDTLQLIPEARIAEAWNNYSETIQAPEGCRVTSAEVHNLRDSLFTAANALWMVHQTNVWTAPAIYATNQDGQLERGCRAIEAIRILWDIANMPDNLASARERARNGESVSDMFRKTSATRTASTSNESRMVMSIGHQNPVDQAKRMYVSRHGNDALIDALSRMVSQTLT